MFERPLDRRGRALRALREFFDLSACQVFTVRQQIAAALLVAALGALGVLAALAWWLQRLPAVQVTVLDPVIERFERDYSVYRIRFAWLGAEIEPCHIVAWHETGKWTVRCGGGA